MSTTEKEVNKTESCSSNECSGEKEKESAKLEAAKIAKEAELKKIAEASKKAKGGCSCG
jgi:hypothetical protein